jgi:hypothetical protein
VLWFWPVRFPNDGAREMDTGTSAIASGSSRVTLGVNSYLWHASLDTCPSCRWFRPIRLAG